MHVQKQNFNHVFNKEGLYMDIHLKYIEYVNSYVYFLDLIKIYDNYF